MIRIEKIDIENFQSHQNTVIEFGEGLNVIVGPSDQGKSAVLRAIKWVLHNEPRGTDFINSGSDLARVTLKLSNGFTLIRERSKSRNRYKVIKPDRTENVYEGFGNNVPDEVVKAHGVPKVLDDIGSRSGINIADQLEGPFLLSETGSVRAKAVGRLTGIHIIDRAIKDCLSDLKKESNTAERTRNEISQVDKRLIEFEDLEAVRSRIDTLEGIMMELDAKNSRLEHLSSIKKDIYETETALASAREFLTATDELDSVVNSVNTLVNSIAAYNRLLKLTYGYASVNTGIATQNMVLSETNQIDKYSQYWVILKKKKERLNILERAGFRYAAICQDVSKEDSLLENSKHQSESLLESYADLLRKAGRCPLCMSEICMDKIDEILKAYF